jgi:uncharacterized membrane protein
MRKLAEVVATLGLVALCATLALEWAHLPDRVPTHFGLTGQPDEFGSRSTLLVLPAIALVLYIVLTAVARYPACFNYPVAVTRLNRAALQDLVIDMLTWLKAEIVWIFAWITFAAASTARGQSSGLGPAFTPVSLGAIAATITLYWYRMNRA